MMVNFMTSHAVFIGNTELRPYECLCCGHFWYEDCDASDYPEYCPGCGVELRDDEGDV